MEELTAIGDELVVRRRCNGDETGSGEWVRFPTIRRQQPELFPIRQAE